MVELLKFVTSAGGLRKKHKKLFAFFAKKLNFKTCLG